MRFRTVRIDPELDELVKPLVPPELRLPGKVSDRTTYALRAWVRQQRAEALNKTLSAREGALPTPPPATDAPPGELPRSCDTNPGPSLPGHSESPKSPPSDPAEPRTNTPRATRSGNATRTAAGEGKERVA